MVHSRFCSLPYFFPSLSQKKICGLSSRGAMCRAFVESSGSRAGGGNCGCSRDTGGGDRKYAASAAPHPPHSHPRPPHSSGSGTADRPDPDARGLANYAHRFFDWVDDRDDDDARVTGGGGCSDPSSSSGHAMRNVLPGIFWIDDHAFMGYDPDINGEGRMQFLDTRILTLPPDF